MTKLFVSVTLLLSIFSAGISLGHAQTVTVSAGSKASIAPLLELTVSQSGRSELKFRDVTPSSEGPTQTPPVQMQISVDSNTGDRYQVTQSMNGPLTNLLGDEIAVENMDFTSSPLRQTGSGISTRTPVTAGSQVVFSSDSQGSGETLTLEYRLSVPANQPPGDYSAQITFTVSSL